MIEPEIVQRGPMLLAGFTFFGDPFKTSAGWTEENEIGRTWQRLMSFLKTREAGFPRPTSQFFELHLLHPGSLENGEYEVFVGFDISDPADTLALPVELCVKVLPATKYAVFHLQGSTITTDWNQMIFQDWLPASGYCEAHPFSFQLYDDRFKGLDRIEESELDVFIPIRDC